jgi:hypothetical protein
MAFKAVAFTVLITTLFLALTPLCFAISVKPLRLGESDISATPNIFIYKADGTWPMDHWANPDCTHPIIEVCNNSATIRVKVAVTDNVYHPATLGTLMNAGGYLTRVSYSANWLNNQETVIYTGDATNHKTEQFTLAGIPYGNQTITVYASCMILLFEDGYTSTYPVPQSGFHSVTFEIAYNPAAPTSEPTLDTVQPTIEPTTQPTNHPTKAQSTANPSPETIQTTTPTPDVPPISQPALNTTQPVYSSTSTEVETFFIVLIVAVLVVVTAIIAVSKKRRLKNANYAR